MKKNLEFNIRDMDFEVEAYKKLNPNKEKVNAFVCKSHENAPLTYFIEAVGQFFCDECIES